MMHSRGVQLKGLLVAQQPYLRESLFIMFSCTSWWLSEGHTLSPMGFYQALYFGYQTPPLNGTLQPCTVPDRLATCM